MNHRRPPVATAIILAMIVVFGAFLLSTTGGAQGRRAMTIDDVVTAVRVTEPALSPDGRSVAYVRTTTDLVSGRRNGDIYIVPAAGAAAPKLLAGGEQADGTPQFSPDSKSVAFISSLDG